MFGNQLRFTRSKSAEWTELQGSISDHNETLFAQLRRYRINDQFAEHRNGFGIILFGLNQPCSPLRCSFLYFTIGCGKGFGETLRDWLNPISRRQVGSLDRTRRDHPNIATLVA